jgi:hypothetical protein
MWTPGIRAKVAGFAILILVRCVSTAVAQEQTTQQLPLPVGQGQTQSADKKWQVTFDSAWSFFSTKETSPTLAAKSVVNYLPVGMQFVGIPNDDLKVEVLIRSGYMDLHFQTSGGADTRYSGWTDTSVNTTVTYYGFDGFQPFFSLAANLPTGQTNVSVATSKAVSDPDVTQIAGFGEGFNLGPTVGVNVPITKDLLFTLSGGYTSRGTFTRSGIGSAIPEPGFGVAQEFKPGDVGTINAGLGYQSGSWSFQGSGSFSYEAVTTVDGANFYQTGGKYSLAAGVGYAWNANWSSKVSTSFSHIGKNRYPIDPLIGNYQLMQEFFNTNSDVVGVVMDTTYQLGAFAVGPTASYLYRDHNGYDSNTNFFLPAKTKWTAGAAAQYAVTNQISLNARAEHLWMTINETPGPLPPFGTPPFVPQFDTVGWIVTVGGKVVF